MRLHLPPGGFRANEPAGTDGTVDDLGGENGIFPTSLSVVVSSWGRSEYHDPPPSVAERPAVPAQAAPAGDGTVSPVIIIKAGW